MTCELNVCVFVEDGGNSLLKEKQKKHNIMEGVEISFF